MVWSFIETYFCGKWDIKTQLKLFLTYNANADCHKWASYIFSISRTLKWERKGTNPNINMGCSRVLQVDLARYSLFWFLGPRGYFVLIYTYSSPFTPVRLVLLWFVKVCFGSFRFLQTMTSQNIVSCNFSKNKLHVRFYYKVRHAFLKSGTGITKWDNFHYKVE